MTVEVDEQAKLEASESTTIVVSSFDRTEVDELTPDDSERTPHNSEFTHNKQTTLKSENRITAE